MEDAVRVDAVIMTQAIELALSSFAAGEDEITLKLPTISMKPDFEALCRYLRPQQV